MCYCYKKFFGKASIKIRSMLIESVLGVTLQLPCHYEKDFKGVMHKKI